MKLFYVIGIIFLLLLGILPLFAHQGVPKTHDGEAQIARFAAYIQAFSEGHIPPRWAGYLNYSYGIPVLNFYYPLPGYFASILYLFNIPIELILSFLFASSTVLSFVFFYLWTKQFVTSSSSIIGSLLYALAPYQLLNIYVRGDIGESLALAILPGIFYFIERFVITNNHLHIIASSFALAFFILSHHGISLMCMPLILAYLFLRLYNNYFSHMIAILVIGFGVSSFFWLPALYEQKYTLSSLFIGDMYKEHFLTPFRLITAAWNYGPNVNENMGQSPQIGLVNFFLLTISVTYLLINFLRKEKNVIKFNQNKNLILVLLFGVTGIIGGFMTLKISTILWTHIPLIAKFQFPWRFVSLTTFCSVTFITLTLFKLPKTIAICIGILLILQTISMAKPLEFITYDESHYFHYSGTTFFHEEASTIWSTGVATNYPEKPVEIISGSGKISEINKRNNNISFVANGVTPLQLRINTLYYPGWKAFVNNNETQISFQDSNNRGIITINTPQGQSHINIQFTETKLRLFANGITILLLILIIVYLIGRYRKKI